VCGWLGGVCVPRGSEPPWGLRVCSWVLLPEQRLWDPCACPRESWCRCADAHSSRTAEVNAILIFLSTLKVSGIGTFTAKAEFCTLCSILMEKTQITTQPHKGFFLLAAWHLLAFLPRGSPDDIFLPFFTAKISPTSTERPSLVTFPYPRRNVSDSPSDVLAGQLRSICSG